MQAPIEYPLLDFVGGDHADLYLHVRPALFKLGQCVSNAHVGNGDEVIGQADGQLTTQMLMQTVNFGAKAFKCAQ